MNWLFTIILLAVSLALFYQVVTLRALLRAMEAAIHKRRRILPQLSRKRLERLDAANFIDSINTLIDEHSEVANQKTTHLDQAEALLNAVHEAIIVFDSEKIIEFANSAAENLFRDGKTLKGQRIENSLRSMSLVEFIESSLAEESIEPCQIEIKKGEEALWMEVTLSQIRANKSEEMDSKLLILYDISRLKKLEVTRREFVANVSHELKTPLTIIKGFAEALIDKNTKIKSSDRDKFANKIFNNAERLHVLVEDLLTLSRLESLPESISLSKQPLASFFEEVAEGYRSRLDPEKQVIIVNVEQTIGELYFDRFRIQQVLDNIIENTYRYAPGFSKIELNAELKEDNSIVECSVVDDGPGIADRDLSQIFERFYRVDEGRSRERGGTGLGLSIVKHIVQQHGGTVFAKSKIGEGTSVYFCLPVLNK